MEIDVEYWDGSLAPILEVISIVSASDIQLSNRLTLVVSVHLLNSS